MESMTIRVTNSTFESADVGEYETADDAYRAAVAAGLEIAAGEVSAGAASSIVQVAVDAANGRGAIRGAVSVSTARVFDSAGI